MSTRLTNAQDGLRILRKLRRNELTIIEAMPALFDDKHGHSLGPFPLVVTRSRPDVTDLVRVQRLDGGEPEAGYAWHFALHADLAQPSWAVFQIEFSAPARCRFALAFEIVKHHDFLSLLRETESFLIVTDVIQRPEDALAITGVPVKRLAENLLAHDLARALVADLRRKRAA